MRINSLSISTRNLLTMNQAQMQNALAVVGAYFQVSADSTQSLDALIEPYADQHRRIAEQSDDERDNEKPGKGDAKAGKKCATCAR